MLILAFVGINLHGWIRCVHRTFLPLLCFFQLRGWLSWEDGIPQSDDLVTHCAVTSLRNTQHLLVKFLCRTEFIDVGVDTGVNESVDIFPQNSTCAISSGQQALKVGLLSLNL